MSLRRTEAGLSNLHLFDRVDLVVFIEGGESLSRRDVDAGKSNDESIDVLFWKTVFEVFRSDLRIKLRPVGSRSVLTSIANDISKGTVQKVCVAMDRDYANVFDTKIICPNVIYTHGYSWENDVCGRDAFERALRTLVPTDTAVSSSSETISSFLQALARDLKPFIRADLILYAGNSGLFDRARPLGAVCISGDFPRLNRGFLKNEIESKRNSSGKYSVRCKGYRLHPEEDCVGHILMELYYRLFCKISENYNYIGKVGKNIFYAVFISAFQLILQGKPTWPIHAHYSKALSSIR